ncbi:MAG: hypothetical protein HKL96_01480 [Phycisphaerales bacterium]|nr:hypothetical protein [Phycisphaerales bacterium]
MTNQIQLNLTGPQPRSINWLAVLAAACVLGQVILLAAQPRLPGQPTSIRIMFLGLAALLIGSFALIYQVKVRQSLIFGRPLAAVAMVAGIMLFAVPNVKLYQWMKDRQFAHMQAIANACLAYASRNHGAFPPSLAVLLTQKAFPVSDLSDPTNGRSPYILPSDAKKLSAHKFDQLIRQNSDFRYVGSGVSNAVNRLSPAELSKVFILYKTAQLTGAGGPMAFADGNVRYIYGDQMAQTLKACNAVRRRMNLPPLAFGGKTTFSHTATATQK